LCLENSRQLKNNGNMRLTYAAANNRPVLVRDNVIIEQEMDRMPVGISDINKAFQLFEMEVQPGDCLYLYTDGYADQFGGPKGKNLNINRLMVY